MFLAQKKVKLEKRKLDGRSQVLVFHRDSMMAPKLRSLILLSKIALLIP